VNPRGRFQRIGNIRLVQRQRQHFEYPFHRRQRALRLADRVDDRPDRLKEHDGEDLEGEDRADLQLAVQNEPSAVPDD
jgi:hypothetical protein